VTTFVDLSAPIEPSPPELPDAFYAELDYMARGTGVTADARAGSTSRASA
jgi:hypothetical protein